ncbi:hypothetical protein E4U19_005979 [Claviceps sp. Clav32 group G5]|nr:hypothetical protein E4U19_005979 [Claviceps sp. Clav32 group G5]KAG6041523.1 hypothetical protein E4U39_006521 [Claviceps sp. Clav50 group G5]
MTGHVYDYVNVDDRSYESLNVTRTKIAPEKADIIIMAQKTDMSKNKIKKPDATIYKGWG